MPTRKTLIYIRAVVRRFSNPVFFMLLLMSFILWYVIKLSYTYTTEINIPVKIDSTYYSVRCGVEGVGYQILMHRIAPRKNLVKLSSDNVTITPSAITPGTYEISSFSLQNSISTKISDLKIISVESPVEIEFRKKKMIKIGLTGGIGSGKSTVCRVFSLLGIPCYDSDAEAKRLMNTDSDLKARIRALLGPDAYTDRGLDRAYVSARVFGHPDLLQQLNAIVHPAVEHDFARWAERQQAPYVIEESAILFESGADRLMDRTVAVVAPEAVRIRRVCRRDGRDEESVRARIAHQMSDEERTRRADYVLRADERELLIPKFWNYTVN